MMMMTTTMMMMMKSTFKILGLLEIPVIKNGKTHEQKQNRTVEIQLDPIFNKSTHKRVNLFLYHRDLFRISRSWVPLLCKSQKIVGAQWLHQYLISKIVGAWHPRHPSLLKTAIIFLSYWWYITRYFLKYMFETGVKIDYRNILNMCMQYFYKKQCKKQSNHVSYFLLLWLFCVS